MQILRYLQDCNTVSFTQPKNFKIVQQGENWILYSSNIHEEKNPMLCYKIEGIFIEISGIYENRLPTQEQINNYIQQYTNSLLESDSTQSYWVNKLKLKLVELLPETFYTNNNTTKEKQISILSTIRENCLENKRKEDAEKQSQKEKELQEYKYHKLNEAKQNLAKLIEGKEITWRNLQELIETLEIKVHPRTKGFINEHVDCAGLFWIVSKTSATFIKGKSRKSIDSFFDFINNITLNEFK
jgi:hypothetical protein